jgi:antitoxin component YwqK of YwqJK toxin-antitoxin module
MLRVISLLGVGAVLISGGFAQTVSMTGPYMGLNGPIHSVREEAYQCTGDPAEKPWRVSEVTYDRRGNDTSRLYNNPDGSIGHQSSYVYDSDGNVTGWAEFYGVSDFPPRGLHKHAVFTLSGGKPVLSIVYKEDTPEFKITTDYDERGNKVREVTLEIGCCTTTRTFKYDIQDRLISWATETDGSSSVQTRAYDADGNITSENFYEKGDLVAGIGRVFDEKRLIKEISIWTDGNVRMVLNTYNRSGQLTLTTIDNASITSRTTFEYYDNGKISSQDKVTVAKVGGRPQGSEDSPTPGRVLEKYDASGNQIERYIYDAKGELYLTQLSSWDDKGRQTRLIDTARDHKYDRDIVYERDSHGNQTGAFCQTVTASGEVKLTRSEKRTITYYDK